MGDQYYYNKEARVVIQDTDDNAVTTTTVGSDQALDVNVVQTTGGGGGTEYTEDAAAASNPVGGVQILVRQDTPAGLVDTDGDNVARRGTDFGAAFSQIVDSSGNFIDSFGGGTQYTEGDTDATITGTAMMMEDAANTLRPAQGDVTNGLDVDVTRSALPTGAATEATLGTLLTEATFAAEDFATQTTLASILAGQLPDGHNVTVDNATIAVTQSGTWNINDISGTISLPTGAATAANQLPDGHNVTVDNAAGAAAVNIQDGGNSITVDQTTHNNLNVNANIQVADTDVSTSNPVPVAGTAAVDAAASGNPVQAGGVFNSTDITIEDGDAGALQLDDVQHLKTAVRRDVTLLTGIDDTYDNTTTTNTSSSVDCRKFSHAIFYTEITKANTPTDILIEIEMSYDDTNFFTYRHWYWSQYIFDDTAVGSGLPECMPIEFIGSYVRVKVTATGTDASNTFTVDDSALELIQGR